MKARVLSIFTAGALVLGVAALIAPAASASRTPSADHHGKGVAPAAVDSRSRLCNTSHDPITDYISSQNFEKSFNSYDTIGVQSCTLKSTQAKITGIAVPGTYFNGPGPAVSENVTFYANASGLPGSVLNAQTVTGTDTAGSFAIKLSAVTITKAANPTFWFSVQVNMDFSTGGQWGWAATSAVHGLTDQWINPGGAQGFGTGYTPLVTIDAVSVSWVSALKGTGSGK